MLVYHLFPPSLPSIAVVVQDGDRVYVIASSLPEVVVAIKRTPRSAGSATGGTGWWVGTVDLK